MLNYKLFSRTTVVFHCNSLFDLVSAHLYFLNMHSNIEFAITSCTVSVMKQQNQLMILPTDEQGNTKH